MKSLFLVAITLSLHFLLGTCSISWSEYCGCLERAVTDLNTANVKNCFKGFFRGQQDVKDAIKTYKGKHTLCFAPSKDGDEECKVVRNHRLSILFRKDIKRLTKQFENAAASMGSRVVLYTIWRGHPDIYDVCNQRINPLAIAQYIVEFSKLSLDAAKEGDMTAESLTRVVGPLGSKPIGRSLADEVNRICYTEQTETSAGSSIYKAQKKNFCDVDFAKDIVRKLSKFSEESKRSGKWTNAQKAIMFKAIRLNFVALKESSPDRYSGPLELTLTRNERVDGYKDNINNIIKLIDTREIELLKITTMLLPNDILTCASDQIETGEACYFKRILDQLVTHFKVSGVRINGKKRIMLSTATDYERLLEYRQMDRILTVVQGSQFTTIDLAEEITDSNNQRFTELKNYFVQLQDFNSNKATIDIAFIDDWITKYRPQVETVSQEIGSNLGSLIDDTQAALIGDIVEKSAAMALAVAEACNPLKTLFGGSSIGDIVAATAAWTTAISETNRIEDIKNSLQPAIDKAVSLGTRFDGNSKDLKIVMDLVKSTSNSDAVEFERQKRLFLEKYSAYSPRVKRPELAEIEELFKGVVATACGIIDGIDTTAGSVIAATVKSNGFCWKIPVAITKMVAIYMEIYDFQFDLMETLATSMRAKIAKREAQNIASQFEAFPDREPNNAKKYRSIYTLSYLTYNIQTWDTIELHCDKLEYAEGGVRPVECRGEMTSLSSLMSRTGRICREDNEDDIQFPVKPSDPTDKAYLNLTNLYKREDVTFQITSKAWLVSSGWLKQSEVDNKAIYVKRFELFLPTVSEESVTYISKVRAVGENVLRLCDDCNQYILSNEERSSKFEEGYEASCDSPFKNPYTICNSNALPRICRKTRRLADPPGTLYPSIYARFKFNIDGYESTAVPDPGNDDMFIKGKITYCLLSTTPGASRSGSKRAVRSRKCCEGANYFSQQANQCTACPAGQPNLNGYYCEKNSDAIMVQQ